MGKHPHRRLENLDLHKKGGLYVPRDREDRTVACCWVCRAPFQNMSPEWKPGVAMDNATYTRVAESIIRHWLVVTGKHAHALIEGAIPGQLKND